MHTPANALRIVLADDQPDAAQLLSRLLLVGGYRVVAIAQDGQEALDAIRTNTPDVAILDIRMPGLTGHEVAKQVRAELAPAPYMVAITGYDTEQDRADASAAGFDAYLTKPAKWAVLHSLLQSYTGERGMAT